MIVLSSRVCSKLFLIFKIKIFHATTFLRYLPDILHTCKVTLFLSLKIIIIFFLILATNEVNLFVNFEKLKYINEFSFVRIYIFIRFIPLPGFYIYPTHTSIPF